MMGLLPVTAAAAFVGSHLVLAHPLRRPMIGAVGKRGHALIYSLVAIVTIAFLGAAYRAAPAGPPLWPVGTVFRVTVTVVMLLAAVLLMGSLVRNPAMSDAATAPAAAPASSRSVFAITRRPMMWSFLLWGLCHAAIYPIAANLVPAAAIAGLALGGAVLRDRKKAVLMPEVWRPWQSQTSFWPFAAIADGRARLGGVGSKGLDSHALGGGSLVWLLATWAHGPIAGWRVGLWHWIG